MRLTAPVSDYIPQSILTTKGDLPVRGTVIPERLAAAAIGKVLTAQGAGAIPSYDSLFDLLTTEGDLLVKGTTVPESLAAGNARDHLKADGAGEIPYWSRFSLGDTGVDAGTFTRNSSGIEEITGLGFQPTVILFLTRASADDRGSWSIGVFAGLPCMCLYFKGDITRVYFDLLNCLYVHYTAGNNIVAVISNLDSDGFDLTFTLTGTASADVIWLALP